MKKIYSLLGFTLFLCSLLNIAYAQSPASASWPLTNPAPAVGGTGQAVTTTGQITAQNQQLVNMTINQYTGPNASMRMQISGGSWPASQTDIIPGTYIQFVVAPGTGQTLNVSSIAFKIAGNGGGSMRAKAFFSTDPTFTNTTRITELPETNLSTTTLLPVSRNTDVTVNEGESLYLRIYPWYHNVTSGLTGKYVTLQDVMIAGTTTAAVTATAPVVATVSPATDITTTTANVSGNVTSDGGSPVTARGVAYGTTENPTITGNTAAAGEGTGPFTAPLTDLTPATIYYARAYATNAKGTSYGEQISFTTMTPVMVPSVITAEVTNVTVATAQGGGTVTATGGADVTARGVVWNTTGTPTLADNKTDDGTGAGSFTSQLSGLSVQTTYYVRAYATNSAGTSYGQEVSFSTPQAPTVMTVTDVTEIETTTATVSGNVTSDGGTPVTARGIAYGTTVNPTIAGSTTAAGEGVGPFSAQLTGLTPGTIYYARAYATNAAGTSYGEQVSFTTQTAPSLPKKVLYITQDKGATTAGVPNWDATAAPQDNDAIIQILKRDSNFDVTVRVITATEANATTLTLPNPINTYDVVVVQESLGGGSALFRPGSLLGLANLTVPTLYNKPYALQSSRAFAVTTPVTPGAGIDASTLANVVLSMSVPQANRSNNLFNGISFTDEAGTLPIFRVGATDNGGAATGTAVPKGFSYNNVVVLDPANRTLAEFPATPDRSIAATGTPVFFNDIPANTKIGTETTKARMIMMGMNYGAINKDAGTNITSQGLTLWRNAIYTLAGLPVPTTAVAPITTAPVVTTTAATNLTTTSVQSGGNVTSARGADVTARGVVWSTSENPTIANSKTVDGTGEGSFTSQVTGLAPATTYYLRAYATNAEGTSYGSQVTITTLTPVVLPTVSTTAVAGIMLTSALSGGEVTATGGAPVTARGVVWSTSQNPTTADSKTENGTGEGSFSSEMLGLSPSTTYYVRAYATNSAGTAYGQQLSFTILSPVTPPVVTTTAASAVAINTAQAGGNVTATGGTTVTARGVVWSTTQNPTIANSKTEDGTGEGSFTSQLSGLMGTTTYYVRAYATNSVGTAYGEQISFTTMTPVTVPAVTTVTPATSITTTSATVGGNVTSDGGSPVTARGIAYGTTQSPTISGSTVAAGTGIGAFSAPLTGLTPATVYYARAYATNAAGTSYGEQVSFTTMTPLTLPTVTTVAATDITALTALGGGNVTATGGATVTARGIVWNTTGNPTTANSKTENGTGTGIFSSPMTGLTATTTYYVRAYATNSVGTAYGPEITFTTLAPLSVAGEISNGTFSLSQNYPNPFHAATTIAFELKKAGRVTLEVYDIAGRRVATLADGLKQAGSYEVKLENTFQDGIYFYRLTAGGATATRKMVISR